MKATPEHRERWQKICRDFRDSGMSQRGYCRAQGISVSSMSYWLRQERSALEEPGHPKPADAGMIPVGTLFQGIGPVLRIRIGGDLVAEVNLPADEDTLRTVLRAARSL
ncbi:IS66 family insertion sequence element accessory protein TnpA [Alkalispirochaeta alkalica]|uniref:IS66 family insertion sequence element accessory protein TnpA n=1 Tax=Alkalispirochaeta alkalica TaxID=46356 RepID=UPI0014614C6D